MFTLNQLQNEEILSKWLPIGVNKKNTKKMHLNVNNLIVMWVVHCCERRECVYPPLVVDVAGYMCVLMMQYKMYREAWIRRRYGGAAPATLNVCLAAVFYFCWALFARLIASNEHTQVWLSVYTVRHLVFQENFQYNNSISSLVNPNQNMGPSKRSLNHSWTLQNLHQTMGNHLLKVLSHV